MAKPIILFLTAVLLTGFALHARQRDDRTRDDEDAIRETVQRYFDGIMRYDADLLRQAFHPDAQIMASFPGARRTYYNGSLEEWLQFTTGEAPADPSAYTNTIVSIDIAETAAVAKTDLVWPDVHYVDYLSLLKIDGTWKIVNKIWYQERE
jgi:ketosteroid isomerase-like protein